MSGLREYLGDKRVAMRAHKARIASGEVGARQISAHIRADDRSGIRRVTIRGHDLLQDSPAATGGFDLGPTPVEYLLASLGGCIAHTVMVQAALRDVPIDAIDVTVTAHSDPRAAHPTDIAFAMEITSDADEALLAEVFEVSERLCPVTALLERPQTVTSAFVVRPPESAERPG